MRKLRRCRYAARVKLIEWGQIRGRQRPTVEACRSQRRTQTIPQIAFTVVLNDFGGWDYRSVLAIGMRNPYLGAYTLMSSDFPELGI